MVDKVKAADAPVPREALGDDDPRASRWRAEYEERMAAQGTAEVQSAEQRAAAKDAYDKAKAAHEVAVANFAAAQEALEVAKAEFSRQGDVYGKFSVSSAPLSPAETLSPGEDTVLMVFPKAVTLQANVTRADGTITGTRSATFLEGIQEVPVSLQNHQYLIDHGVRPYSGARITSKSKSK